MKRRFATFSKAISRNSPDCGEWTLRDRSQDCFNADEQYSELNGQAIYSLRTDDTGAQHGR